MIWQTIENKTMHWVKVSERERERKWWWSIFFYGPFWCSSRHCKFLPFLYKSYHCWESSAGLGRKKAAKPWIKPTNQPTSIMILLMKGWSFRLNAHTSPISFSFPNVNFIDWHKKLKSKWWHAMLSHFALTVIRSSTLPMFLIWCL